MLQICDKVDFSGSKRVITAEGFMRVPATLSRCGVYDYSAEACRRMPEAQAIRDALKLDPSEPLRVYRSPEQVFAEDSMASFANKPVTNNHPPEWINAKNARYYTVGYTGDAVERDGQFQKATLIITDAEVIKEIEEGKKEISNGYDTRIVQKVGVTDDGEEYHAEFQNIRGNHIAIVSKGRAGNSCRISDSNNHGDKHMNTKTIVLDGIEHEVSENAAGIIGKLQGDIAKVQDSLNTAKTEHSTALATLQAEVDTSKQKVLDAEAKVLDAEALDALIETRSTLVADVKTLAPEFDCKGKSAPEIIKGVVTAVCDGIDVEGKPAEFQAAYFQARFDALLAASDNKPDNAGAVTIVDKCDEDVDEGEKARQQFTKSTETSYKKGDK
jgi:hypothetical protein